jgi:hypothetical protein
VSRKPVTCLLSHLFKRSRLFEEVGGPRNDFEADVAVHSRARSLVEIDHGLVSLANDEKRRRVYERQRVIGEVRSPTTRDYGLHTPGSLGRSNESGPSASARAEKSHREAGRIGLTREPVDGGDEPIGEHSNVEAVVSCHLVDSFFLGRKEVEEQRPQVPVAEYSGNEAIPLAEAAASAAMREKDHSRGSSGNSKRSLQHYVVGPD